MIKKIFLVTITIVVISLLVILSVTGNESKPGDEPIKLPEPKYVSKISIEESILKEGLLEIIKINL